ncbi:MAG: DUF308 domain-containing protein [Lachnospiraceae bacterium]|nr:DUF308 domain-containing protein [Lachnospiraceae bacterium]
MAKELQSVQEKVSGMSGIMKLLAFVVFVAMVAVGFVLIFKPGLIILLFPFTVGVIGLFLLLRYLRMGERRSGWDLISAIINIVFAVIILLNPEGSLGLYVMIEVMVAIWAIYMGFSNIFGAFGNKREQTGKSGLWMIIGGILACICGFFLLGRPILGTGVMLFTASIWGGVTLAMVGFAGLAAVLSGKKSATADEKAE